MERVLLTVMLEGAPHGVDLELPTEVPAEELAALLVEALGEPGVGVTIEAHPPGRTLEPHESLAMAGVWDGAWLCLRRNARASTA